MFGAMKRPPRKKLKPAEQARIAELFARFEAQESDPRTELDYGSPFELVVAVALSAQATDVSVNKATDKLFKVADTAVAVNASVENIGARRLQTVMEKQLEEISFTAADRTGETITIDAAYVQSRIGDLAGNADLSKFIL
jgi:hypothetical protein